MITSNFIFIILNHKDHNIPTSFTLTCERIKREIRDTTRAHPMSNLSMECKNLSLREFLASHEAKGIHWTTHKTSANLQPWLRHFMEITCCTIIFLAECLKLSDNILTSPGAQTIDLWRILEPVDYSGVSGWEQELPQQWQCLKQYWPSLGQGQYDQDTGNAEGDY